MADHGEYPIGAFVVVDRPSLGPLVARLRSMGRLKSGVNVTALDVRAMRLLPDRPHATADTVVPSLRTAWAEVTEFEAETTTEAVSMSSAPTRPGASRHRLLLCPASTTSSADLDAFLASLSGTASCTSPPSTYMAVHTTGAWSEPALLALMTPSPLEEEPEAGGDTTTTTTTTSARGRASANPITPPIAYINQLRCYSRACCAVAALPPSLAALREAARGVSAPTAEHDGCRPSSPSPSSASAYTFAELFGGIGMFRLGLARAGAKPVFAVEFAAPACAVYAANFHPSAPSSSSSSAVSVPLVGDITEIPDAFFPHHDILTAGFPCQSFSKAGPASGLHDAKGWLFHEVVRVLRASQPRAFLLENVENLLDVQEGAQLATIRQWLQHPWTGGQAGRAVAGQPRDLVTYTVHQEVLDGAAVTPQRRRRVYFVGLRRDELVAKEVDGADCRPAALAARWIQPVLAQARQNMSAMRAASCSAANDTATTTDPWHRPEARYRCVLDVLDARLPPRQPLPSSHARLASLQLSAVQWEAVRRSKKYRAHPDWRLADLTGNARTLMGSYRTSFQLYSEFVPLSASTTEATSPTEASEAPCRFYAVRECARLQGIPETFTFLHNEAHDDSAEDPLAESSQTTKRLPVGAAYKLVGNAVNPLVIECIGVALINQLRRLDQ